MFRKLSRENVLYLRKQQHYSTSHLARLPAKLRDCLAGFGVASRQDKNSWNQNLPITTMPSQTCVAKRVRCGWMCITSVLVAIVSVSPANPVNHIWCGRAAPVFSVLLSFSADRPPLAWLMKWKRDKSRSKKGSLSPFSSFGKTRCEHLSLNPSIQTFFLLSYTVKVKALAIFATMNRNITHRRVIIIFMWFRVI